MAGEENGEGNAMSFVANWIAGNYSGELASSSVYNDLHNLFRSKYGRNAMGLRNALQHYVKNGDIQASKGGGYAQMYVLAGAAQDDEDTQEAHALPTDETIVVTTVPGTYNIATSDDQPTTASAEAKYLFFSIIYFLISINNSSISWINNYYYSVSLPVIISLPQHLWRLLLSYLHK